MRVQLIPGENDDVILPLPDELFLNEGWLEGDEILFTAEKPHQVRMDNLSRLEVSEEEFKENIANLLARIEDPNDVLRRVIVKRNGENIATLQKHDAKSG